MFNASEYYAFKLKQDTALQMELLLPRFTPAELAGQAAGTNTNWQSTLYRKGFVQNHDLNLSGGTDQTQYGLGLSYKPRKALFLSLYPFDRFSLRATINQKIS